MFDAARHLEREYLDGPAAEISGPETMYIPTTQIRLAVQLRDHRGRTVAPPMADGPWHRRSAIDTETACGVPYGACFSREYELVGELCPHCFTERERELAQNPDLVGRKH